jgi:hypothetical protein
MSTGSTRPAQDPLARYRRIWLRVPAVEAYRILVFADVATGMRVAEHQPDPAAPSAHSLILPAACPPVVWAILGPLCGFVDPTTDAEVSWETVRARLGWT